MCGPDGECDWFANMLKVFVGAANAREAPKRKGSPLDCFMEDLEAMEDAPDTKGNVERYPPADRIVAIGDVHGDVEAMRESLRMSGVINKKDRWTGGKTVLVQVGDQLDRGNKEREIYQLLFELQDKAPGYGGAVHILLGNHELMNSRLDFRYVTKGGFKDFEPGTGGRHQISAAAMRSIKELPSSMRARAKSLVAGGELALELAERTKISVIVGDNVFVHAGLSPTHLTWGGKEPRDAVKTLAELNHDVRKFLLGKGKYPLVLKGGSSPVWLRDYSRMSLRAGSTECKTLAETLKMVHAKRMVVGHTPQRGGINSACGGRVWRIDTGMSEVYGGVPEAIEISKRGRVRIFTSRGVVQASARYN